MGVPLLSYDFLITFFISLMNTDFTAKDITCMHSCVIILSDICFTVFQSDENEYIEIKYYLKIIRSHHNYLG